MGAYSSQLERDIGSNNFPPNEHFFGFMNFGNTCYCNSVLQALYFCKPFRDTVINYKLHNKGSKKDTLLSCLADLFHNISTQKRRVGQMAPKKFVTKLKKENEAFDNFIQQDAHEFLNYLLNHIADLLQAEKQAKQDKTSSSTSDMPTSKPMSSTWIHDIFQGTLTNETRCLNCETIRTKDEDFLDLSVDVEQNTSITHCLQCFSNLETMQCDNKYYCEICCCKQEAQKRMRLKRLPTILALHLKRFKYSENMNRFTKLSYRVAFPLELRLFNTSDDAVNSHRLYSLVAVVVHCGSGPNRGHYITIVRSHGLWLSFDDEIVEKIDPRTLEEFFGVPTETNKASETAYILFYQAQEPVALKSS